MKKTIKTTGLLLTLALLALGCKDEMTNESFTNGSATIHGTAWVDLNLTTPELEYVPQGTRIYARINSEDLVEFPSSSVNYGDIVYDTVVGADGAFTFVVAANSTNVTVTFAADDFMYNQVQFDETVEPEVFELIDGAFTEVVNDGEIRITEITFTEK